MATLPLSRGPGPHLHRLIKRWLGLDYRAGCGCEDLAAWMDQLGPAGCHEHIEEIVTKLIVTGKQWSAKYPDLPLKAKVALRAAQLPGGRVAVKKLVLLAIKRAERTQYAVDSQAKNLLA